jgi:hypothetical protein
MRRARRPPGLPGGAAPHAIASHATSHEGLQITGDEQHVRHVDRAFHFTRFATRPLAAIVRYFFQGSVATTPKFPDTKRISLSPPSARTSSGAWPTWANP